MAFKKILCPIDFDENSLTALEMGKQIARQNATRLGILHIVRPSDVLAMSSPAAARAEEARAVEQLNKLEERIGDLPHEIMVRYGNPADEILKAESEFDAGLVVVATHGRTGVSHFFLGNVAERVVRESICPVMTMRRSESASAPLSVKKILCPIQFDANSITALGIASDFASQHDATVQLLHVSSALPVGELHILGGDGASQYESDSQKRLRAIADERLGKVRHHVLIRDASAGFIPDAILSTAQACGSDLIVMATHGRTGMSHLLLGSVAERVVREARCPVLTVRAPAVVAGASRSEQAAG